MGGRVGRPGWGQPQHAPVRALPLRSTWQQQGVLAPRSRCVVTLSVPVARARCRNAPSLSVVTGDTNVALKGSWTSVGIFSLAAYSSPFLHHSLIEANALVRQASGYRAAQGSEGEEPTAQAQAQARTSCMPGLRGPAAAARPAAAAAAAGYQLLAAAGNQLLALLCQPAAAAPAPVAAAAAWEEDGCIARGAGGGSCGGGGGGGELHPFRRLQPFSPHLCWPLYGRAGCVPAGRGAAGGSGASATGNEALVFTAGFSPSQQRNEAERECSEYDHPQQPLLP